MIGPAPRSSLASIPSEHGDPLRRWCVALVVLLVPGAPEQISLGARSASALAELGVTSVALVHGEEVVGLVLEGWAFDSRRANEAASAVGAASATALTTVAEMAVSRTKPGPHGTGPRAMATASPTLRRVETGKQSTGREE